jgi:hypothetical protein
MRMILIYFRDRLVFHTEEVIRRLGMAGESTGERSFRNLPQIRVSRLTTAEQFVLGVCRCWDVFMNDPDPTLAWRELTPVFVYMNVVGALCAFERAFKVLHRHPLRTLRFKDVDSADVGADEARILCGLAHLQRCKAHATIDVLSESLTRYGVRTLLPPLARIAAILDLQGHRLPAWH